MKSDEAFLWLKFLPLLTGVQVDTLLFKQIKDTSASSDAANWGFACYWCPFWYNEKFHKLQVISGKDGNNIAWRELYAIMWMFFYWGAAFSGMRVLFYTDNKVVYHELIKKYSKNKDRNDLIRNGLINCIKYKFSLYIQWVNRERNVIADLLSKNKLRDCFLFCKKNSINIKPVKSKSLTKEDICKS